MMLNLVGGWMADLVKRSETLPDTIDKLNKYIRIGEQKLKAYEAKLKAIEISASDFNKIVRKKAYQDTFDLAVALLLAEAKLGELLKNNPPGFHRKKSGQIEQLPLPSDITQKQSHYAQELNRHQDIIEESIMKSEAREDIPRRNEVLRLIYKARKKLVQDEIILPKDQYNTIIIDPYWPINKIHRDTIPQGRDLDYSGDRMSLDAIKNLKMPASDNCHLFLWTTQKYLPISFEILKGWGFKYIFTMVWCKTGGFQPFNLPQYNCEFAVYGRIGSPEFLETKSFFTCFHGKRREHSRKPKEFYDLIRRVCPEPRIDIFSREQIEGFECWGDEIDKF